MAAARPRAWAACFATAVAAVCASRAVLAQVIGVPPEIQAELLSKLEAYDRGFPARAGDTARVLLVVKPGVVRSERAAVDMRSALGHLERIGNLPHQETIVPYTGADALASRVRADHAAVVFVTPGFDDDVESIRAAMNGSDVLTLAAVPDYVPQGVVLGFSLESGKPRVLINLDQAKRQNVNFSSDVLRLMTVYR